MGGRILILVLASSGSQAQDMALTSPKMETLVFLFRAAERTFFQLKGLSQESVFGQKPDIWQPLWDFYEQELCCCYR